MQPTKTRTGPRSGGYFPTNNPLETGLTKPRSKTLCTRSVAHSTSMPPLCRLRAMQQWGRGERSNGTPIASTSRTGAMLEGGCLECFRRYDMTRSVVLANPRQSIHEAARLMEESDAGALPVGDNDRLIGVITDRDIAVRAVAQGLGPDTPVEKVMSAQVLYCYEDEDVEHVAKNMGKNRVRRLPVLNREKRLVGIVSFGDLSGAVQAHTAGDAIAEISEPGGPHSQASR